ncbi:MAG: PilZ domain-containing protein [Elusimicrobia bacterium]|nr:PilZ domain-containing protein [Elusimicrobiota bacterium]
MLLQTGVEQRKFPRVAFRSPIKIRLPEGDMDMGELAQDISLGGIRVRSTDFVPLGSVLRVMVQFSAEEKTVEVRARVVWVRYFPQSEVYQLGLEFVGEMPLTGERIAVFVRSRQKGRDL